MLYPIIDQRSLSLLSLYRFFHLYTIKDHNRFYRFFALLHYQSKIIITFIALLLFSLVYNQRSLSLLSLYHFIALLHYRSKIIIAFIALSHYWSKIIIAFIALLLFSLVYYQRSLSLLPLYHFITLLIKDHYHFYRFIAFFTCIQSKIIIGFNALTLYRIIDKRSL